MLLSMGLMSKKISLWRLSCLWTSKNSIHLLMQTFIHCHAYVAWFKIFFVEGMARVVHLSFDNRCNTQQHSQCCQKNLNSENRSI